MSGLSQMQQILAAFAPLAATVVILGAAGWFAWRGGAGRDAASRLLSAAVAHMPPQRVEWGKAMLAELSEIRGRAGRWSFAMSCARVAIFPPPTSSTLEYWRDTMRRLGPLCGVLSMLLPAVSLPLLYLTAIAAGRFTSNDDFFNGELVPGLVGALLLLSLACMLAGVPLGIAGYIRRERARWLSVLGPIWSAAVFGYLQIVQLVGGG